MINNKGWNWSKEGGLCTVVWRFLGEKRWEENKVKCTETGYEAIACASKEFVGHGEVEIAAFKRNVYLEGHEDNYKYCG